MENRTIKRRLLATAKKLRELPRKKFNYEHYVAEDDGKCGTVCCAAGWYPKWFPKSGLKWARNHWGDLSIEGEIFVRLRNYHGLTYDVISSLFEGYALNSDKGKAVLKNVNKIGMDKITPTTVAKRFEVVATKLKDNPEWKAL